jgi:hypothetical protein
MLAHGILRALRERRMNLKHLVSTLVAVVLVAAMPQAGAATGKSFGEHCVEDSECQGGVCFHKRIKSRSDDAVEHDGYCSMRCDEDSDCPVPPTKGKCGKRGMCKRPD